ncbi:NAD(P)/FAD-dependent oxidoreductase [Roseomonas sp. BN140053]|uniref:NAD(P)/FAD-dependent oxidoreductase n=1 Tax=Roseomonas sp. BN140053 TaxID=3391898 RepID=UPI0039EA4AA8
MSESLQRQPAEASGKVRIFPAAADARDAAPPAPAPRRPRVVIVGAGFGGLEVARALRRSEAEVTLVDRRNHHLFQPLLYQVATAALSPGDIAWPVRSVFRGQQNVTVLMTEVNGVDLAARVVRDGTVELPFDFLVLATGSNHSYFGHDEWERFAPGLKSIEDATSLRQRLLSAFERAELATDPAEQRRLLTFVVIGGGPTGVEMAGAISELAHRALPAEFRRVDPGTARVVLVEAGPRILPSFPEELADTARRSLEGMQVEVRTAARVTRCDERGVTLGDTERLEAGTVVWAAGVVASPAAAWIGAEHDRAGRAVVGPDLSIPGHPEVFVIGDTAAARDNTDRPVPGIAPAAKQMGQYVGKLIAARIAGRPDPAPFSYRHHGDLATIGRKSAVVSLGRMRLTGFPGWLFWCLAHVWYLIGFRSRVVVAFDWLWSYVTAQRGARLITGRRP